jgi:REP element-mobilizing transposase RayT
MPLLESLAAKNCFERELERVRRWYGCYINGYVVMPEHVHLLISEPERSELAVVIQMLCEARAGCTYSEFMDYPHDLTELLFTFVSKHPEEFGTTSNS